MAPESDNIGQDTPNDADLVTMVHPDTQGSSQTSRKALREVWAPKGWVEATPEQALSHDLGLNVFEKQNTTPAPPDRFSGGSTTPPIPQA